MSISIHNHRVVGVPLRASPNRGGRLVARYVVIHYTASGDDFDTAAWFASPTARASAHLVVRRDGGVVQCLPFDAVGWHAGRSRWVDTTGHTFTNLNRHAIGIELENWGALQPAASGGWMSWSGDAVAAERGVAARHKFGTPDCGWERFPAAQVKVTRGLVRALCTSYGIAEILGHDDIAPGRKSDPGPAWDMDGLRAYALAGVRHVP